MALRELEEATRQLQRRTGELAGQLRTLYAGGAALVGTPADRDALFGMPATAAEVAALANAGVVWFNTVAGWLESYYAPDGTAGLTARGLVAGTAAGWYPVGEGPAIRLVAQAQQSMSSGNVYVNWADLGTGASWRRGGAAWFAHVKASGYIRCERAGRYEIRANVPVQAGSGVGALWLSKNAGTTGDGVIALQSVSLLSGQPSNIWMDSTNHLAAAGDFFRVYAGSVGSAIFCQGADGNNPRHGEYSVRYLGPALVSE
ncbi:minor tail protein [Microbacterium phage Naby]|nr:minor tail protein [Microbacterium phage Naby]